MKKQSLFLFLYVSFARCSDQASEISYIKTQETDQLIEPKECTENIQDSSLEDTENYQLEEENLNSERKNFLKDHLPIIAGTAGVASVLLPVYFLIQNKNNQNSSQTNVNTEIEEKETTYNEEELAKIFEDFLKTNLKKEEFKLIHLLDLEALKKYFIVSHLKKHFPKDSISKMVLEKTLNNMMRRMIALIEEQKRGQGTSAIFYDRQAFRLKKENSK